MNDLKLLLGNNIVVTQTKSCSKLTKRQISTLYGLSLGKINKKSSLKCSESVLGMLKIVEHIVKVDLA